MKTNPISELVDGTKNVTLCGRMIFIRKQGGIAFGRIQDEGERLQVAFRKADWPSVEAFNDFVKKIRIGTIMCIRGDVGRSKTEELTLWANAESEILQTPQLEWPDKFHGIADENARLRKRYLDSTLNPDVRNVFHFRHQVILGIRGILASEGFMEVETPVLGAAASGANARPFQTHIHSKDADLFLRIAPETYLKRYVAAGFNRVFEIGKQFRNEGIDSSHLPEFTSVEWYGAYMTHLDNMKMFKGLFTDLAVMACQVFREDHIKWPHLTYQGVKIDLESSRTFTYRALFEEYLGEWPEGLSWKERDLLFKKKIRPNLINPTYITEYPAEMAPLAARNKDNPALVDMWQLVINGWEIVKCYQELVDAELQEQLLKEQMAEKANDPEAIDLEPDFIECMKYGMPPMSGLGLGIDRLVCLLANQTTLRDVVMFPILL